jgi:hypothetical protein
VQRRQEMAPEVASQMLQHVPPPPPLHQPVPERAPVLETLSPPSRPPPVIDVTPPRCQTEPARGRALSPQPSGLRTPSPEWCDSSVSGGRLDMLEHQTVVLHRPPGIQLMGNPSRGIAV